MNRKALEEKRVDLQAQMSNILETAKAEKRALTEAEENEFTRCENEIKEIDETIEREDKNNMEIKKETTLNEKEVKEFANYIRATVENRADGTNLAKSDNGAVIPTSIVNKIIDVLTDVSPVYAKATKYKAKGTLIIPKVDNTTDDITVGYQEEFTDMLSHSNKFSNVSLTGFLIGALTKISKSLLNNSDFDLTNFVVTRMAEKMKIFYEAECINGTTSKISGIIGSYDATNMKITLAKKSTVTADELIDLQEKVIDQYQGDACWLMNRTTRTLIRKLKDGQGNYLLNPVFGKGWTYELLGKPVFCTDSLTALGKTASKPVIVYGDLSGLAIKETGSMEMQVLNELFAPQHAVGVCAYNEIDAKVENTQKIAVAVSGSADA